MQNYRDRNRDSAVANRQKQAVTEFERSLLVEKDQNALLTMEVATLRRTNVLQISKSETLTKKIDTMEDEL